MIKNKNSNLNKLSKENRKFSNLNKSSKEKKFDAVKFKNDLQSKLLKDSKAKNMREYVDYVNKIASKSPLNKNKKIL